MGIDKRQLLTYIIEPSLAALNFPRTENDTILMLGTAEIETNCGTYIRQLNRGIAYGIYQIEHPTYLDLFNSYINTKSNEPLRVLLNSICGLNEKIPPIDRVMYDLRYATLISRVYYYRIPFAIPEGDNAYDLAYYYKKYYNTLKGASILNECVNVFQRLIDNYKKR